jgi:hypothetical protein
LWAEEAALYEMEVLLCHAYGSGMRLKPPPLSGALKVDAVLYIEVTTPPSEPVVSPAAPTVPDEDAEGPESKTPLATFVDAPGAVSPWQALQNSVIVEALPTSNALV